MRCVKTCKATKCGCGWFVFGQRVTESRVDAPVAIDGPHTEACANIQLAGFSDGLSCWRNFHVAFELCATHSASHQEKCRTCGCPFQTQDTTIPRIVKCPYGHTNAVHPICGTDNEQSA